MISGQIYGASNAISEIDRFESVLSAEFDTDELMSATLKKRPINATPLSEDQNSDVTVSFSKILPVRQSLMPWRF